MAGLGKGDLLERQFNSELIDALSDFDVLPRVNIAPTQPVVVVKQSKGKPRIITMMRWGLIPAWAKDPGIGNQTINARSETIDSTVSFSDSVRSRRCLIPADGFYEWKKSGKVRQPYCFEVGKENYLRSLDCGILGKMRMARRLKAARF